MLLNTMFVLLGFIFDGIINNILINDFMMTDLMFIPWIGFSAMLIVIRKMDTFNTYAFVISFGMFYDFFYAETFALYTIVFVICAFILKKWAIHLTKTLFESVMLIISTIFVNEFIVYFFMIITSMTKLGIQAWLIKRMFLTLIINAFLCVLVIYFDRLKDDLKDRRDLRMRKEERISWVKLLSKQ
ncbi:MAG: rod shape-determining protein MreD [Erysipelotrichaceae bacterium]